MCLYTITSMLLDSAIEDKFKGCLLGLALGDALCAPFEGGVIERFLWSLIGKTKAGELRFTDDTQMSLDIANSFLRKGAIDQDSLAREFSNSYQWSRGYGPGAGKILKRIRKGMPWYEANVSVYKDGSFGNGAAMRAPVLALCFVSSNADFKQGVIRSAEITHSHPSAIDGALLVAYSTDYALSNVAEDDFFAMLIDIAENNIFKKKLHLCQQQLKQNTELGSRKVKEFFGNGMTAESSCITAVYIALKFKDKSFMDLINFIKKVGGDTDTIAAMSGAIWGAFNGAERLKYEALPRIENTNEILEIAEQLYKAYSIKNSKEIDEK